MVKDVLEYLRNWSQPMTNVHDFYQAWLKEPDEQGRLDIFNQLRDLACRYQEHSIEYFLEEVLELWDAVRRYEENHPDQKLQTLEEAEEILDIFEWHASK